ncbi:ALDOLASE-RELATED [Salix koriyanagi]|uniref:ALDOLASE-RELATED n=1 Tax=Salix koriyanagi TaxID=2511006 RepID=A0A9Q0PGP4_9ROSI|nr:ALDOLASE-RELATED [Salix koriyanagi]
MLLRIEQAELRGKSFLCRTAASFVSTRIGIIPKAPILPKDLGINKERKGGLIVVGSYVPKTTKQVEELQLQSGHFLKKLELDKPLLAFHCLESRHPGVPYIVFPGNVGDSKALADVVKSWALPSRLSSTKELLLNAERGGYAVGAFNVYNMEGAEAVVAAAEEENSPAILQIPITVHFYHGNSKQELVEALDLGFDSLMVDGSHLSLKDNIAYTKYISLLAHSKNMLVEAELGRLSGTEDDLTVEDYEARLTDVNQAEEFIDETGIDALAVCIGNVHGKYPASGPNLRLDLLKVKYEQSNVSYFSVAIDNVKIES